MIREQTYDMMLEGLGEWIMTVAIKDPEVWGRIGREALAAEASPIEVCRELADICVYWPLLRQHLLAILANWERDLG